MLKRLQYEVIYYTAKHFRNIPKMSSFKVLLKKPYLVLKFHYIQDVYSENSVTAISARHHRRSDCQIGNCWHFMTWTWLWSKYHFIKLRLSSCCLPSLHATNDSTRQQTSYSWLRLGSVAVVYSLFGIQSSNQYMIRKNGIGMSGSSSFLVHSVETSQATFRKVILLFEQAIFQWRAQQGCLLEQ